MKPKGMTLGEHWIRVEGKPVWGHHFSDGAYRHFVKSVGLKDEVAHLPHRWLWPKRYGGGVAPGLDN